jgi:hypothetical protein
MAASSDDIDQLILTLLADGRDVVASEIQGKQHTFLPEDILKVACQGSLSPQSYLRRLSQSLAP